MKWELASEQIREKCLGEWASDADINVDKIIGTNKFFATMSAKVNLHTGKTCQDSYSLNIRDYDCEHHYRVYDEKGNFVKFKKTDDMSKMAEYLKCRCGDIYVPNSMAIFPDPIYEEFYDLIKLYEKTRLITNELNLADINQQVDFIKFVIRNYDSVRKITDNLAKERMFTFKLKIIDESLDKFVQASKNIILGIDEMVKTLPLDDLHPDDRDKINDFIRIINDDFNKIQTKWYH